MKKNIYFMIFPVIMVVLMIIIFIFDKRTKQAPETEAVVTSTSVPETTAPVSMVMMLADFDTYGLQEDAVPEAKSLILEYQNAKLHADAAKMLEIYGKTVEDENLTAGLENDRRLYQRFDDTKTFVTAGVMENSYLVFVTSKIKFHFVDTLAPSLTWTYVQKDDAGKWTLKDPYNLTPEETAFLRKVASSEEVRTMSDQMKKELAAAVISDAQLANIYRTLSGSSVTSSEAVSESSGAMTPSETESDAQISIIGTSASDTSSEETSASQESETASEGSESASEGSETASEGSESVSEGSESASEGSESASEGSETASAEE